MVKVWGSVTISSTDFSLVATQITVGGTVQTSPDQDWPTGLFVQLMYKLENVGGKRVNTANGEFTASDPALGGIAQTFTAVGLASLAPRKTSDWLIAHTWTTSTKELVPPAGIVIPPSGGPVVPPPTFPVMPPPGDLNPVDWLAWLAKVIYVGLQTVVSFLEDPWKAIGDAIWNSLPPWIRDAWTAGQAWLDNTTGLLSWFKKTPVDQGKDLERIGLGLINDFVLKWLGLEVSDKPPFFQLVSPSLSKKPLLEALGSSIAGAFGLSSPEQLSKLLDFVLSEMGEDPKTIHKQLEDTANQFLAPLIKPLEDAAQKVQSIETGLKADQAATIGTSIAVAGGLAFVLAWLVDQGVELGTLGISKNTGRGIRSVLRAIGLQKWTREFASAPLAYGVQPWLGRYYDQLFRTHIFERDLIDEIYIHHPDQRDLWLQHYKWYGFPDSYIDKIDEGLRRYPIPPLVDRMLFWGKINGDQWKDLYLKNRWRPDWLEARYGSMWASPRAFLLARLLDAVPTAEGKIRTWLSREGHLPEDVESLINAFYELAYKDDIKALIAETIKDYVDGLISAETLDANLTALGRPAKEIAFDGSKAKLQQTRERTDRLIKLYHGRLAKGLMSEEDFRSKASELGLQSDRIDLEVDEASLETKSTTPKTFTEAALRRLYSHNLIDSQQLQGRLVRAGWDPDDAALDVVDEDIIRTDPDRTKLADQALKDLDSGILAEEDVRGRLKDLLYSPTDIDLKVATTQLLHQRTYIEELVKIYVKDFATDKVTEPEFRGLLGGLGLQSTRIEELVFLETERKVPAETLGG